MGQKQPAKKRFSLTSRNSASYTASLHQEVRKQLLKGVFLSSLAFAPHPFALRNNRFISITAFLLALWGVNAVGQTEAAGTGNHGDVRATIRQLVRSEQTSAARQTEAAEQPSSSVQDQARKQPLIRIIPYGRNNGANKGVGSGPKTLAPVAPHLTYWGGPVMSNIQVVAVFWGPNVAAAVTGNGAIDQFYIDITSSQYFDALTEYYTAGITGPNGTSTSNQTIGHGTFAGKFTITPSLCPGTAACTISDAQIQAELTNQVNNHVLPAPQTDAQGNINTYYAIYFSPNVTIALAPGVNSCVQGGFCAYHANTGSLLPYGVFPDFSAGGCSVQGACGSGTTLQKATIVSSHEMAETVTDPEGASASVLGPPLGWFDNSNQGEIADLCDPLDTTVSAGSVTYSVELLFSNLQNQCISAPPVFSMPGPAGGAGPSVPFKMALTIKDSISNIIGALNYLGTVHFTSSDPGAVLPADYTFTAADAGVHTFPFTLSVLGNQTITATDTRASGFTGTTTVNVNTVPDMTIGLQHTGNFGIGQTGSYTITTSNLGGGPTSGTVTVADTLPPGLTAAAMSGTGWTCNVSTVTCTRADVLAAGNVYPPITLTATIGIVSTTEINVATVSGGGETVTSDDQASDPTTFVNPGVDLGVSANPSQLFSTQGITGVSFTATVVNFGSAASTGTVTLAATLTAGLTATSISGAGWNCTTANLTCTRSDAVPSAQSYPPVTITFDVALNAPLGFSSVGVNVSDAGDTDLANNSISISTDLGRALQIFSNTPTETVFAGGSAQYQVGVFGNAAAGTVTFSCSGLPSGASCSFNPPSLTNNSIFVIMTIATTARSAVVGTPQPENGRPWFLPGLLLAATVFSLLKFSAKSRRRKLVPILGACMLLIAGIIAGCGGGGSTLTTVTKATGGTPAGAYSITATATPSNANVPSDSRTMTLVVQ